MKTGGHWFALREKPLSGPDFVFTLGLGTGHPCLLSRSVVLMERETGGFLFHRCMHWSFPECAAAFE